MIQPNQLRGGTLSKGAAVSLKAVRHATDAFEQTLRDLPDAAVSTAKIIISAEEKLRQRLRSGLRVAVATLFFGISGLISLGANVTVAIAKKVSPETTRVKKEKHLKASAYHRHSIDKQGNQNRGVASWYGNEFHNRKTASGVRFDTHKMMAAHRTLPFGTKVRVTNLTNHRSCIVEITDRGPFSHHRIIDVSYAAAGKLGMMQSGTAKVQIEVLGTATSTFQDIASQSSDDIRIEKTRPVFDQLPVVRTSSMAGRLAEVVAEQ